MAATIYFSGGEDTSFSLIGSASITTNGSLFRPGWARCGVDIQGSAAADPPPSHALSRKFINKSNAPATPSIFYSHAIFSWIAPGGSAGVNCQMLRLLDASGNPRLMIRGAASNAVKISVRNTAGTISDLVTSAANALPIGGLSNNQVDLYTANNITVSYGPRTDISFSGSVISSVGGNFPRFGLVPGSGFTIIGSASNDGTYVVTAGTSNTLTCGATTFVTESAGASVLFSTNGLAALYFGGTPIVAFAGEITANGVSQMAQIDFANVSDTLPIIWSEPIVSDQPTFTKGVWSRPPTSAGTTQLWLPNTVGNIDEVVINDTNFISTASVNQVSTWAGSVSPPSGGWLVDAIVQEARLAVDASGPQSAQFAVEQSGTISTDGVVLPATTFDTFSWTWPANPLTSADWDLNDITTGTFDLGVESLT